MGEPRQSEGRWQFVPARPDEVAYVAATDIGGEFVNLDYRQDCEDLIALLRVVRERLP
jgi:hypothetical protein